MSDPLPATILFVDDNDQGRSPLITILRQEGFEVLEASTGSEALRLAQERPNLVILDVHLPDMSGFEVCQQIKTNPATAGSLVLHLSGHYVQSESSDIAGTADSFLIKPVDPLELLTHVKTLLRIRQVEAALQESEARLRDILNQAPVVVYIKDLKGHYLFVNRWWQTLFQQESKEVTGKTVFDVMPPERAEQVRANDLQVLEAMRPLEFEETLGLPDGPHTYLSVKFPLFNQAKAAYAVCGVSTDITLRVRAEQALRQAEERYRSLFENALQGIFQTTPSGRFLAANPALARMLGYSAPHELMTHITDIGRQVHVSPKRRAEFKRLLEGEGVARGVEAQLYRRDGSILWASLSGRVVEDPHGGPHYFQGILEDITERKKAENAAQFRVHQQALIARLGQRALASTDLSALMNEAVGVVADTLKVEFCRVLELQPDGKELVLRAGEGWEEGYMGLATVKTGIESQAGYTLLSQGPLIVEDLRAETRFRTSPLLLEHGVVSTMSVIIHGASEPFGVLIAETTRKRTFVPDDIHFLQAVANVLATAIDRKHAEEQLQANRAELGFARRIQQKLFPTSVPEVAGLDIGGASFGFDIGGASYPAEAIGGDYFDYLSLLDGGLAVAIGDVSGHGIGPALLMAELRAYLRAFAQTQADVGAILALANRVLGSDIFDDRFITLLLGRLDPHTLAFRYTSAGHSTGYILADHGLVKHRLTSTSIPLGILPDVEFAASGEIALAPGDIIVFVTDGIVEACSPDGSKFGEQRTLDIVRVYRRAPARQIVDNLYHAVRAFCQHLPQIDDITATIIKVAPDRGMGKG
jgi:PAS domain S-box-containing protein